MPPLRQPRILLLLVALLLVGTPAWAQPSDDQEFNVLTRKEKTEIQVEALLELVADKFQALLIVEPTVANIRIKITNRSQVPLTWGTLKQVLKFYEVHVHVNQQNPPDGPWMLKAIHQRSIAPKSPPPYRFVNAKDLPKEEQVVTAVFQISNGAASTIFANLRGLMARDPARLGNILYIQGPELLIMTDTTSQIRYYERLIEALDVAGPRKKMQIFQITNAPVNEVATVVTTLLTSLAGSGVGGGGAGGPVRGQGPNAQAAQPNVIADTRTNKLIVAAFPIDFPLVTRVINALDVPVGPSEGKFHVYQCLDADAEDLADKVQELFTGQAPARGAAGGGARPVARPRPRPSGTGNQPAGLNEVETRIVADERTNSLLIQAEPGVYDNILAVLEQLDKKRRRVLIEAEVWEITTPQDALSIGFELAGLTNAHEDSTRPAAISNFGLSQVTPVTDANGNITRLGRTPNLGTGITAALTRDTFDKLPIIMNALHNYAEANLVTRPFAMTNDNTPATFTITNRQPFLTTTTTAAASQQNVQFAEANTALSIEPQVNSNQNLTLKLTLELSSFTARPAANLPPPSNSRRYEGEVTVPNGEYVVFGGLESESNTYSENKVPFLGDIPILGYLFKTWTRDKSATKLYIFVRPTIFSNEGFGAEIALGGHLREKVHIESERSDWLPPIVAARFQKGAGYTLQDEAFDVFGSGTANPFRGTPSQVPDRSAEDTGKETDE